MKSKVEIAMVTMFDGTGDFAIWKKWMLAHLSVKGLKDVLTESTSQALVTSDEDPDPDVKAKKQQDLVARSERDEKAMNMIFMCVGDQVLRKLDKCTTAAQVWDLLDKLYMEKTLPNRVHAQIKVYSFKMQESKTIART